MPGAGGTTPHEQTIELTVIGSGPAAPQADGPGSGLLVRSGRDTLLLECGTGVISYLRRRVDPRTLGGVVVTHFHADHYLDLVALRYLLPWEGLREGRLAVHLPPGGAARLEALATVISERREFFAEAFEIREYQPGDELRIGALRVGLVPSRHYVPAWGAVVSLAGGPRLIYSGDTGPNPALIEAARGADLLVVEATLGTVEEDVAERGHLTLEEAVDVARQAAVPRVLVTHYPSERRAAIRAATVNLQPRVQVARPGLRITLRGPRPGAAGEATRRTRRDTRDRGST